MAEISVIAAEDIEKVLDEIDQSGFPQKRHSTGYCLVARGNGHYPPKYVIWRAYLARTGTELKRLSGGVMTNKPLERLGFVIEKCECHNANRSFSN